MGRTGPASWLRSEVCAKTDGQTQFYFWVVVFRIPRKGARGLLGDTNSASHLALQTLLGPTLASLCAQLYPPCWCISLAGCSSWDLLSLRRGEACVHVLLDVEVWRHP